MPKTIADLMAATGRGREACKQAIRNGEMPGRKIGGRWVITDEAYEDFVYQRGIWAPVRGAYDRTIHNVQLLHSRKENATRP